MGTDPLSFLKETTSNITSNVLEGISGTPVDFSPFKILVNLFFVLVVIFIAFKFLKRFANKSSNDQHVLKEIDTNLFKIQFIQIGKKLYLIAANQNQLIHLDTIEKEQEIINMLTSEQTDQELTDKIKKNSPSFNNILEGSLKKILKNSQEIENIK